MWRSPRAGRLYPAYRAFHEQGFVPILIEDDYDTKTLVEACVEMGLKGIEYTSNEVDNCCRFTTNLYSSPNNRIGWRTYHLRFCRTCNDYNIFKKTRPLAKIKVRNSVSRKYDVGTCEGCGTEWWFENGNTD